MSNAIEYVILFMSLVILAGIILVYLQLTKSHFTQPCKNDEEDILGSCWKNGLITRWPHER